LEGVALNGADMGVGKRFGGGEEGEEGHVGNVKRRT
jgi:hypothetical protein